MHEVIHSELTSQSSFSALAGCWSMGAVASAMADRQAFVEDALLLLAGQQSIDR